MTTVNTVEFGSIRAGGGLPFVLVAGPCVIEGEEHALFLARALRDTAAARRVPFVFKASFDKANRTSITSSGTAAPS